MTIEGDHNNILEGMIGAADRFEELGGLVGLAGHDLLLSPIFVGSIRLSDLSRYDERHKDNLKNL